MKLTTSSNYWGMIICTGELALRMVIMRGSLFKTVVRLFITMGWKKVLRPNFSLMLFN